MKIDDLPEDEYVTLADDSGNFVECRILGRIFYDDDEYAVCRAFSGESPIVVVDTRIFGGQYIPVGKAIVEGVYEKFLSEHPDLLMDEQPYIIELTDEEGQVIRLEFLDLIDEQGKTYFFGIDADDDTVEELTILEVDEREDMEEYSVINDEKLLEHLYELFRKRHEDEFHFLE